MLMSIKSKGFMLLIAKFRNFMNNECVNIESFHNNNNFLAVCANRFETILSFFCEHSGMFDCKIFTNSMKFMWRKGYTGPEFRSKYLQEEAKERKHFLTDRKIVFQIFPRVLWGFLSKTSDNSHSNIDFDSVSKTAGFNFFIELAADGRCDQESIVCMVMSVQLWFNEEVMVKVLCTTMFTFWLVVGNLSTTLVTTLENPHCTQPSALSKPRNH